MFKIRDTHPILGAAEDGPKVAHDEDVDHSSLVTEQGYLGLFGDHRIP
jgi:hypothetical protein